MECLQNVESIDVPAINGSKFPILCHAQAERLVKEAEAWLRLRAQQSGCEDKEGKVEKLIASQVPLVACQFFPHSPDLKVALTLIKTMIWLFIFDEVMDDPSMLGTDCVGSQQFCGFILQVFFGVQSSEAVAAVSLLPSRLPLSPMIPTLAITVLEEWWSELRVGMSTRQQARFCTHFSDYVLVQARQAQFREEKKVPDLEEYLRMRMVGAAMCVVEMLAETDSGIELDEEDLRHPATKRLNAAIGHHTGVLNDYVGLAREHENGDYLNVVTVLHYRNNSTAPANVDGGRRALVPFREACLEAWEITRALEEECVASAKEVQEWARKRSKPGLLTYVSALCSMSAANWLFSVQSSRFTAFNKHLLPSANDGVAADFVRIRLTPPATS